MNPPLLIASGGHVIPNLRLAASVLRASGEPPVLLGLVQPELVGHVFGRRCGSTSSCLIAVAIGFAISMALALIAHRYRRLRAAGDRVHLVPLHDPVAGAVRAAGAAFPGLGLSRTTAEVALVSYTLLILFRNILTGLRSVPSEVLDAARGMGMSRRQMLWRVELPLAMPAIIAGLRIATVSTSRWRRSPRWSTTQGLGVPIFSGISDSNFKTELIAAGGLAVLLAFAGRRAAGRRAAIADAMVADAGRVGALAMTQLRRRLQVHRPQRADPGRAALHDAHLLRARDAEDHRDRDGDLAGDRAAARRLAGPPPPWLVRRDQPRQRLARAAEPRRAGDRVRVPRDRAKQVLLALVVLAVPPIITNAYVGVDQVDRTWSTRRAGWG